eukprot:TRINITY_DN11756_c0_g1_i3.p2 TRINITY_DN11756_c0_g1~~TRINITY_DN11756_c0_g1_i3.p2  ORF type:complete len:437 (+),score=134.64 TRINITY_DN11756_c0_g1_i3:1451-2761(+)
MLKGAPWDIMMSWVVKYGEIAKFSFFNGIYIISTKREHVKHIFGSNGIKIYQKDRKDSYKPFLCLLGTGLVTSEGKLWKKQRTLISPAFRVEILNEVSHIAVEATYRLVEKLKKVQGKNIEVEMAEEFRILTLQVIGEAVLSLPHDVSDQIFPQLYLPIAVEANKRTWYPYRAWLPIPSNFKFNQAVNKLNKYLTDLIEKRHEEFINNDRKQDILDRILENASDQKWTNKLVLQLRDEIKTFLFAGHETSSLMLTWTLYELTQNPDCLEKVLEESKEILKKDENGELIIPEFDTVRKNFTYTINCMKEALRKYSVVPLVTRVCVKDDTLPGGYDIPKGTKVVIPIQAIHHNPDLWPEPMKFIPERFEEKIDPYSFLAFITGPRSCVGQYFALLESKLVLAILLREFKFKPINKKEGERHISMVPVCPLNNMTVTIE